MMVSQFLEGYTKHPTLQNPPSSEGFEREGEIMEIMEIMKEDAR